jgi:hypothetical protein
MKPLLTLAFTVLSLVTVVAGCPHITRSDSALDVGLTDLSAESPYFRK